MEKLRKSILYWRLARISRPNQCNRCSMPPVLKLLCPKCGSSEYCSDACMIEDGKKHFKLCLGIAESDQMPEEVPQVTSSSESVNLDSSQPLTGGLATMLLWKRKRSVTDGRCTLCYEPSVGVQLLCSKCGKSEYCSASCMVEDGRNHFDFCDIRVGSTQACSSNTWNSLQQDSATSLNASLLSEDNAIMPPTTRFSTLENEKPFSSEFRFGTPWKSPLNVKQSKPRGPTSSAPSSSAPSSSAPSSSAPSSRSTRFSTLGKSPGNVFRPVFVKIYGRWTIEWPLSNKHLPLKKRPVRTNPIAFHFWMCTEQLGHLKPISKPSISYILKDDNLILRF